MNSRARAILLIFAVLGLVLAVSLIASACTGPTGPQGERGLAGPQGIQGPQGLQGSAGSQGPQGVQGSAGPQGTQGVQGSPGAKPSAEEIKALIAEQLRGAPITVSSIARGGRLYDNWVKETKATAPTGNQPLWALQTTNTRNGTDTWRCKECHGWDYKGKGGAYSKGSHYTGFVGVYDAGVSKSPAQLLEILKGATDSRHDFSKVLDAQSLTELAGFLSSSMINETPYIDYATKKPIGANATHGAQLYSSVCAACHGADGKQLNFGSATEPEYVGTIAVDNPWEFLHKVRFGQPSTSMPAGSVTGWNFQDVLDVLAHAQTLPEE
ncbi:MAG: c-type cytochrome [Chloroflexi bacterium]|nr:c-type cytochrome [Chloroflexota bacterium]